MSLPVHQHPDLLGLECLRCAARLPVADHPEGCPSCRAAGTPASLFCVYADADDTTADATGDPAGRRTVRLPYQAPLSLGEGGTPLLRAGTGDGGADLDLRLKWEGANPTGSHKDRFSAVAVARALHAGYRAVAAASSGNAGVSLAAYCGRAGLRCEIAVTDDTPARVVSLMRDLGADVVSFPSAEERWHHLAAYRDSRTVLPVTNFLVPPVGSSPFGIEGYKKVAEEILADLDGRVPDWVVVPTSRGDLLWGVHLGFRELCGERPGPRLCLVEPFPRVAAVLSGGLADEEAHGTFPGTTAVMPSLAGNTVTLQALYAVRRSGGTAVVVGDEEVRDRTRRLWRAGLPLETSSAAALVAVDHAVTQGHIAPGSLVVAVGTAHGLKGM